MLELIEKLDEKRFTGGKYRTQARVRCVRCGYEQVMLHQNYVKHERECRTHCINCVDDRYHRMTGTRIWRIWLGLRWRVKDKEDRNYGGRGISVCGEWSDFNRFYEDMIDGYSDDLTIERIDVNGPYCKDNCKWVSIFDQQANKRNNRVVTYKGERMHLAELCRRSGFSKMMLSARLNRGMTGDEAVADAMRSPYGKSNNPKNVKRRQRRRMSTTSSTADRETGS